MPPPRAPTCAASTRRRDPVIYGIGTGIHSPMSWRLCEIANERSGKPVIVLHGALKDWFDGEQLVAHVTVTDETDYAASFVVVERRADIP